MLSLFRLYSQKLVLGLLFCTLLISNCKQRKPESAEMKVDASHSQILDAEIEHGMIKVMITDTKEVIEKKIYAQLSYTLGNLDHFHSSANVGRNVIKIRSRTRVNTSSGPYDLVLYSTTLVVAWSREFTNPGRLRFVLPNSVNELDLNEVYTYYNQSFYDMFHVACIDPKEPEKPAYKFWRYMAPRRIGCPLTDVVSADHLASGFSKIPESNYQVVGITATLQPSRSATVNKKPEHQQIWRDGKLKMIGVFTPDKSLEFDDQGVQSLFNLMELLVTIYGRPANPYDRNMIPALANFDITRSREENFYEKKNDGYFFMKFDTQRGPLEFHFFMKEDLRGSSGIRDEDQSDLWKKLKAQMAQIADVDVYAYFGHSALGKNVRPFIRLPTLKPNQYSIFWFVTCNSFMYLDNGLRELNQQLNPGTSPYKYFDVIAPATISNFGTERQDLPALMDGLMNFQTTYREILDGFEGGQRPIVFGEEDNGQPF